MQVTKVAIAVALATGLLAGCNSDSVSEPESTPTVSPLNGGYWEISADVPDTFAAGENLPNIYIFDGTTQKYYNDDNNFGTYTLYSSTYEEDIDAGTLTFNYYSGSDLENPEYVTGSYSVTDGVLSIFDTDSNDGNLSAADNSSNETIKEAVTAANAGAGVKSYLQILDTNKVAEKAGELRIKLSDSSSVDSIESGKLTVDLIYQEDENTEQEANGAGDNAYISLYAKSAANAYLNGEVVFENGVIKYRDESGSLVQTDGTFELGEDLELEVTWELNEFSFSVNGVEYGNGFTVADVENPVTYISFKLGDSKNTTNFELLGDNVVVYAKNEFDEYDVVLEEHFEGYASGYDLVNKYHSSTNEATVVVDGGNPTEPPGPSDVTDNFESYDVGTQIDVANPAYTVSGVDGTTVFAEISSDQAKSGDKSLFIHDNSSEAKGVVARAFSGGAAENGSVSTSVYIPTEGYVKSTYLYLGNSSSASSSQNFTEVIFGKSDVKFRNENNEQVTLTSYTPDTWVDVTLAWEAADDDTYDITVTIDGTKYTEYDGAPLKAKNSADGAPELFALYIGDNSTVGTYSYFDDLDSSLF